MDHLKEIEPGTPFWFCNCGNHCEEYNNCCSAHNRTHSNFVQSQYECLSMNSDKYNRRGFFAISICPDGYNNETIIEKCNQNRIVEHGPPVVHTNKEILINE